jgi:hypothetical protein
MGIPEIIQKIEPRTGYKIICGSGPEVKYFYIDRTNICKIVALKRSIRKFSNIVVAYIGGQTHPPICLFETLLLCQPRPLGLNTYIFLNRYSTKMRKKLALQPELRIRIRSDPNIYVRIRTYSPGSRSEAKNGQMIKFDVLATIMNTYK